MGKVLEKSLKDARKEGALLLGSRRVLGSLPGSKLVVLSRSAAGSGLREGAIKAGVPVVEYGGTSVALGKACGLQFRASAVSLTSISDSGVKSVLKEAGDGGAPA
ncbi:MAG: 50S ribosomal protein L7ae [Nitrosopumilus sp.]|nr:50S ribosomal protein L7ae [Nitrosopumilus sp.]CAI9832756.1 Ribosomal protein L7Ae [Nitrosopumilaceae archaeon]MDA7941846.1 50S ribosomal protein L7ae [Nitrosopumilus sp.]MDA7943440.1 50S ribosomal protein L7ae [Nitrosopumilus sp.]MDA7945385.1 50S ribosomal protein L7ae [Nitrosopumilus sp.]